jgi:mRNA-degrading endonuclease RelE of RelBE toxin-antitoxin system
MAEKETKWDIAEPKRHFQKFFETHTQYVEFIPEFRADVTENPFRHENPIKIKKLKPNDSYPPDCYRWRKKDLRIVYSVSKPDKLIFPLDADTAGGIAYKK